MRNHLIAAAILGVTIALGSAPAKAHVPDECLMMLGHYEAIKEPAKDDKIAELFTDKEGNSFLAEEKDPDISPDPCCSTDKKGIRHFRWETNMIDHDDLPHVFMSYLRMAWKNERALDELWRCIDPWLY